jgi:hypothetical protein
LQLGGLEVVFVVISLSLRASCETEDADASHAWLFVAGLDFPEIEVLAVVSSSLGINGDTEDTRLDFPESVASNAKSNSRANLLFVVVEVLGFLGLVGKN